MSETFVLLPALWMRAFTSYRSIVLSVNSVTNHAWIAHEHHISIGIQTTAIICNRGVASITEDLAQPLNLSGFCLRRTLIWVFLVGYSFIWQYRVFTSFRAFIAPWLLRLNCMPSFWCSPLSFLLLWCPIILHLFSFARSSCLLSWPGYKKHAVSMCRSNANII